MDKQFQAFLLESDLSFHNASILLEINNKFLERECICEITNAKSGYLVSYVEKSTKRKVANIVSRKSGMKIRLYADHIYQYDDIIDTFPEKLKKEILKASTCKRLINPDDCNQKCAMGYRFMMNNEEQKKCRFSAFMPVINEENLASILQIIDHELHS